MYQVDETPVIRCFFESDGFLSSLSPLGSLGSIRGSSSRLIYVNDVTRVRSGSPFELTN